MILEQENIIQIAGVLDKKDAETIIKSGIKVIGFPLVLGYHKEDMNKKEVQELIKYFANEIEPVLITYLNKADDIIELTDFINANIVQLHNDIEIEQLKKLRKKSKLGILKSIIIKNDDISNYIDEIEMQEKYIDIFITDTFDPTTGASGATGNTHNWDVSKSINDYTEKPLILAGGLKPDNVYEAVKKVKPFGVDSHTGVEDENGRKSFEKLTLFKYNAQKAFNS